MGWRYGCAASPSKSSSSLLISFRVLVKDEGCCGGAFVFSVCSSLKGGVECAKSINCCCCWGDLERSIIAVWVTVWFDETCDVNDAAVSLCLGMDLLCALSSQTGQRRVKLSVAERYFGTLFYRPILIAERQAEKIFFALQSQK